MLLKMLKRNQDKLHPEKVKSCRQAVIDGSIENFCEQVRDHFLRDTKDEKYIATHHHAAHQMVANGDVANLSHALVVHCNRQRSLRVSVLVDWIRFLADEAKEPEHVFYMCELLAASTRSDRFRSTGGVGNNF